jgi:hypothetical protein
LINLEVWQRIFLDGEDPQHVVVQRQRATEPRPVDRRRSLARVETS